MNNRIKNLILSPFNLLYRISPESELKILFFFKMHKRLDLNNPKTFNEKVNWLKLYDTNESKELKKYLSDKYTVRDYVEKKIGNSHILNELYWEGINPKEIPFDLLPNKFVIKVTHGSTFNIICKDKSKLDKDKTIKTLNKWLKTKYLICYGESWYGQVKPRIIIEKYLENEVSEDLIDYKVFCFNGEPKIIDVHTGREDDHRRNIYDVEWNHLSGVTIRYKQGKIIDKPKVIDKLLEYSKILSKDFMHVRVDFFIIKNKIIFTEFTFANGAGFSPIKPKSFDLKMGKWLDINHK